MLRWYRKRKIYLATRRALAESVTQVWVAQAPGPGEVLGVHLNADSGLLSCEQHNGGVLAWTGDRDNWHASGYSVTLREVQP